MTIIIFGASGDLAKRKLFPSLSLLKPLPKILAYSRSKIDIHSKISEFYTYTDEFLKNIEYIQGEYTDLSHLKSVLKDEIPIFYFSVPPSAYQPLLVELQKFKGGKVAIEKPFAFSLENFNEIIKSVPKNFDLFLIDHYLLKPMSDCLPAIFSIDHYLPKPESDNLPENKKYSKTLKSNYLPEIMLNKKYIKNVKVISKEEMGIEGRTYFDDTGIVKDIVQNHLFIICYKLFGGDFVDSYLATYAMGQYLGYEKELGRESKTETMACMILKNKNEKYKHIDFLFYAGKGLNEKRTEIRIKFGREYYRNVIEEMLIKRVDSVVNEKMDISNVTINTVEETLVKVEKINDLELVINFAPRNEVFLNVKIDGTVREYVIVKKKEVVEAFKRKYGELDDHALIFQSILNGNKLESTDLEIAKKEWEIFQVEMKRLIFYEKGVDVPDEIREMFDSVDGIDK